MDLLDNVIERSLHPSLLIKYPLGRVSGGESPPPSSTYTYTATAATAAAVPVVEVTVIAGVADIVEGPTHLLGRGYTYVG